MLREESPDSANCPGQSLAFPGAVSYTDPGRGQRSRPTPQPRDTAVINLSKINPRGIIWIASYPRSGNTWTRAFINSLTHIMQDPTFEDVDINRVEAWTAAENAVDHYTRLLGKPGFRASPAEIATARPRVQAEIARSAGRPVYVKTHNAHATDHGSPLINMGVTAGAVYLVRNPLDVAISLAHFSNTTIDRAIDDMATPGFGVNSTRNYVRVVWGSWSEHVGSWAARPHPAFLVVRYEDLVTKPRETFGSVARHLMMTPNDEQLERAIALTKFDRLRDNEATAGFVERPHNIDSFFREGRAGQWRERLSADQVARVVKAHHPLMRRFNYLPEQEDT